MRPPITGATVVAGVVGRPVRHSLSPLIHNAWLTAAGIDGVYAPLSPTEAGFPSLIDGLRGGALRGLNVTLPFKAAALALADHASERATAAGAANVLVFEPDGEVTADNTDGLGLMAALDSAGRDFDASRGPIAVLGAGGAAQGAIAALLQAGAPRIRLINRTRARSEALAGFFGAKVTAFDWSDPRPALAGAAALINATSLGLAGGEPLDIDLAPLPLDALVMDMVYKPLETPLLAAARAAGRPVADGLAMLIGQAAPAFERFFGAPPPAGVDVRGLCLQALGESG